MFMFINQCNGHTEHLANNAAEVLQPLGLDVIIYAGNERWALYVIHPSHDLRVINNVVVCVKCGRSTRCKSSFKLKRMCTCGIKVGAVTAFGRVLKGLSPVPLAGQVHRRTRGNAKGNCRMDREP